MATKESQNLGLTIEDNKEFIGVERTAANFEKIDEAYGEMQENFERHTHQATEILGAFEGIRAEQFVLKTAFSTEGITLDEGVENYDASGAGGSGATPVEMRFTGSKVQVRGIVSFSKESGSKRLLTFDTKLYPAPKIRNRYRFVQCAGRRVMRMYIATNGSIWCEWIVDLDGTVYTGPMAWAQIDAEWETD
ncbi:MAG: hypothetical protein NC122_06360 [Faecalibacterium sp.]|nr:hypothetical protein [Ruminococcus sp.]MCM1392117.1 hypothetical protein [Ruminococcus sp.]MCM1485814.1 hypothetical protein [Faecalibacterium sp.]